MSQIIGHKFNSIFDVNHGKIKIVDKLNFPGESDHEEDPVDIVKDNRNIASNDQDT